MKKKIARLILGDQLNLNHSWFSSINNDVVYIIAEMKEESTYATHHIQKLCAFFSAMAHFSEQLKNQGHHVEYFTLDESVAFKDFSDLILNVCQKYEVNLFEYQRPDEFRLLEQLTQLALNIPTRCVDSEHFILPFEEINTHFPENKKVLMENFYRKMRKRLNILIDDSGKPEGVNGIMMQIIEKNSK